MSSPFYRGCVHRDLLFIRRGCRSYSHIKKDVRRFEKGLPISRTRNIGIIAHIDAGKTTVTERMLYLAGATTSMGDVDSGSTVTDFLDMERERGITIQSAAISFEWRKHRINLIDTPGHVDFTVEVERCARVLDGVVTVLDGSAGVQAQTLTVWRQASKFGLPASFFINKMDKRGVNFTTALDSIEQKLGVKGLVTVRPIYSSDGALTGFLDLIKSRYLSLHEKQIEWKDVTANDPQLYESLREHRDGLLYALADVNSNFMSLFLDTLGGDESKVEEEQINKALRISTLSRSAAVVTCGSALRCAESVLPVLDQVVDYLPSPRSTSTTLEKALGDDLSALVFKVTHDKKRGQLNYVRIYTGSMKNNSSIYNTNREKSLGPVKIFSPQSDELIPIDEVSAGNIAVLTGLGEVITGDTLLASLSVNHEAVRLLKSLPPSDPIHRIGKADGDCFLFSGIDVPEPVFFCSVEPPTTGATHEFERALKELAIEDPSLKVRIDSETGQTVVETMGELHMEVLKDRLVRGYRLNVFVGPLQVSYREAIMSAITHTATVEDTFGLKGKAQFATVTLHLQPEEGAGKFKRVEVDMPATAPRVRHEWQKAINEGCSNALYNGPMLGFPLSDIKISLKELVVSGGKINPSLLSAAAHKCVSEALKSTECCLLEPLMQLEIRLEEGEGAQSLLQELTRRRANIESCQGSAGGTTTITARLPLAEMEGLSSTVRTLSSGLGSLHVQAAAYQPVSEHHMTSIVASMRGRA